MICYDMCSASESLLRHGCRPRHPAAEFRRGGGTHHPDATHGDPAATPGDPGPEPGAHTAAAHQRHQTPRLSHLINRLPACSLPPAPPLLRASSSVKGDGLELCAGGKCVRGGRMNQEFREGSTPGSNRRNLLILEFL